MPKLTESIIQQALEFAYNAGANSATELAESYKKRYPACKQKQVDALIKWQIANGAASGFVTGLGGVITLPVAVPANIASVLFIQMRMIAAIAIIGGYDPKDERVKAFALSCLVGSGIKNAFKEIGIELGKKIMLGQISQGMLTRISRFVSLKLLSKFGEKGVGKILPIVGGVIGGTMDAVWVASVGKVAKSFFIEDSGLFIEAEPAILE